MAGSVAKVVIGEASIATVAPLSPTVNSGGRVRRVRQGARRRCTNGCRRQAAHSFRKSGWMPTVPHKSPSSPIPESSIAYTWRVRPAAHGTRPRPARHRGPAAIPCDDFQTKAAGVFAPARSQARTFSVCPSGAPDVARICWGGRIFQRGGSWNLLSARRTRFFAQQASHLRCPLEPLETFRCARDRPSYTLLSLACTQYNPRIW